MLKLAKEPKTVADIQLEINEENDKANRARVRLMNDKESTFKDIKKNGLPDNFQELKGKQVQKRINVSVEAWISDDLRTINELLGRDKSEFYITVQEAVTAYIRRYKLNRDKIQTRLKQIELLKSEVKDILSEDEPDLDV